MNTQGQSATSCSVHYLKPAAERPGWLPVERLLGEKGIPKDSEAGRETFARLMERRRAEETLVDYGRLRRGWFVGSEQFRNELLAVASERVGVSNYSAERMASVKHPSV